MLCMVVGLPRRTFLGTSVSALSLRLAYSPLCAVSYVLVLNFVSVKYCFVATCGTSSTYILGTFAGSRFILSFLEKGQSEPQIYLRVRLAP